MKNMYKITLNNREGEVVKLNCKVDDFKTIWLTDKQMIEWYNHLNYKQLKYLVKQLQSSQEYDLIKYERLISICPYVENANQKIDLLSLVAYFMKDT